MGLVVVLVQAMADEQSSQSESTDVNVGLEIEHIL